MEATIKRKLAAPVVPRVKSELHERGQRYSWPDIWVENPGLGQPADRIEMEPGSRAEQVMAAVASNTTVVL